MEPQRVAADGYGETGPGYETGLIDFGIQHCRAGRWREGAHLLRYVAAHRSARMDKAGLFLSYLGCAIAREQEQEGDGLALCRRAVEVEFYQPESWANLAEVLLLAGKRGEAAEAIERGLDIDSEQPRLQRLRQRMGLRRSPVVGFLARTNPLNRLLGTVRSQMSRPARPESS